jgi:hypothetical protein
MRPEGATVGRTFGVSINHFGIPGGIEAKT